VRTITTPPGFSTSTMAISSTTTPRTTQSMFERFGLFKNLTCLPAGRLFIYLLNSAKRKNFKMWLVIMNSLRRLCLRRFYVLESLWLLLFLSTPLVLVYSKYVCWRGFATRDHLHAVRHVRAAACRTTDKFGPRCSICSRSGMPNNTLHWFSEPTARSKKNVVENSK
jgi:hypothetical protein